MNPRGERVSERRRNVMSFLNTIEIYLFTHHTRTLSVHSFDIRLQIDFQKQISDH